LILLLLASPSAKSREDEGNIGRFARDPPKRETVNADALDTMKPTRNNFIINIVWFLYIYLFVF
jgi:hypothetical protein